MDKEHRRRDDESEAEMNKHKTQWRYWFAGMKKPAKLPKGCEGYSDVLGLWKEDATPTNQWCFLSYPRRWRVKVLTCKCKIRFSIADNLFMDLSERAEHANNEVLRNSVNDAVKRWFSTTRKFKDGHCQICGKPVEIVKGRTNK